MTEPSGIPRTAATAPRDANAMRSETDCNGGGPARDVARVLLGAPAQGLGAAARGETIEACPIAGLPPRSMAPSISAPIIAACSSPGPRGEVSSSSMPSPELFGSARAYCARAGCRTPPCPGRWTRSGSARTRCAGAACRGRA